MSRGASRYANRAFRIVENIAFMVGMDNDSECVALRVVDLNDTAKIAEFIVQNNDFVMKTSSFPENGKRWYEALYIMERNRSAIMKECMGVQ
jgi:hypothetical protein